MSKSLNTHTASYNVDTYRTFKNRVSSDEKKGNQYVKMRTNYAVGFYDTRNEDNTLNRIKMDPVKQTLIKNHLSVLFCRVLCRIINL